MPAPIACAEAMERLWEFLDRGLRPDDHRAVEEHLAWCLRCCGELAFARELRRFLREKSTSDLPGDVETRLERFIDDLDEASGEGVTT